jgi:hypothetical protein
MNFRRKRDVKAAAKAPAKRDRVKTSLLYILKEKAHVSPAATLCFERYYHQHSLLQLVKLGVIGDINTMDLNQGCIPWSTGLGPVHKLGLLFVDAMTLAYSMNQ